ncbi:MAG: DUF134 domain-containing protein [Chloroflexota bacterium]|nr:DUF134 domain-containing protein [Chloroflexota bacterium]
MSRPIKCRRIQHQPCRAWFKPVGIPMVDLEEVNVTLDEYEAVRLADLEDLYQEQAAEMMGVSRQTFGNILNSAHKKIADCLVNGKVIKIEGGKYATQDVDMIRCNTCSYKWAMKNDDVHSGRCPQCGSLDQNGIDFDL